MRKRKIFVFLICFLGFVVLLPGFSLMYWTLTTMIEPLASRRIYLEFEKLPSDVLIKKLKLHNIDPASPYPQTAMEILAQRKEKSVVPYLIKLMKSWHPDRRYQSMRALGSIGDRRAIEPLLGIVNRGEKTENYREALSSLCQIGYEPAHAIVLEMLKRPDGARNGSAKMMEYIGKREDIPLLEAKYSSIHEKNEAVERIEKGSIRRAIDAIKQREGLL